MIDSFYFRANRQDATVKFVDPRDPRALGEVARLPGVRLAEPIREVPVRLRNGHITELIALTGVEHGATLRTFTDSNGVRFAVPRAGVVLSDKLARMLQVAAGETLRIDVLEGRRRKTEVQVAGVVPEFVGLAAYIDIGALDRLTGDARAYTGARVMIDGMREGEFVSALKEVPGAGSALMRSTATASFRKLLAENIYIIISFYIGFGAAITYGVVYNAARISLSERGREMASLRVLGFTRGETAYILLGELAILVLAALPFGCVFGYGLAFFVGRAMETEIMRIPFIVSSATYGTAAVAVLIAAALSAIAVAWRVVRLDLIRVLKTRE
jgi:putative ABC transport system permease protein